MDVKIGAGYVRVSTTMQEEYSPDSQLKLIREYAKRAGYVIPDEYVFQDDGISGKSADKRPAFRLMVAQAKEKNPPFSAVFVWKYSRFARNAEEALVYKNLLRKNGVDVISISEPQNDSPFSSLIERIIEWMDEYYLIRLSDEVRRGMKEKASRGEATGKAPFGYSVEDKRLVPNEYADTVRYFFELCAAGKSFREIAVIAKEKNILTPRGKNPNAYAIRYILRNPAYIGKIRWDEEDHDLYRAAKYEPDLDKLPDGKHEPIISRELWDAVQKRMSGRDTSVKYLRRDNPIVYPLKGLLRCGTCGATMIRTQTRGKDALQCYRYSRGQCRVSHCIKMELANEAVINVLEQAVTASAFTFAVQKPQEPRLTRDWDKLIAQEEARLKRAKTAFLDGAFSSDEYKEVKAAVVDNIAKLTAAKEKDAPKPIDTDDFKGKVIQALEVFRAPDATDEAKNKALRSVVNKIVFNKPDNTFDIYFAE